MSSKNELHQQLVEALDAARELWYALREVVPSEYRSELTDPDQPFVVSTSRPYRLDRAVKRAESAKRLVQKIQRDIELEEIRKMKTPEAIEYLLKKTQQ